MSLENRPGLRAIHCDSPGAASVVIPPEELSETAGEGVEAGSVQGLRGCREEPRGNLLIRGMPVVCRKRGRGEVEGHGMRGQRRAARASPEGVLVVRR